MDVTGHRSPASLPDAEREPRKAASIRDVAKAAGVSYQTVSRVINSHPNVREETRERVEAAIQTLGFRRNATAFALASGVTRAVTVLTSNTTLYGYAATLQGLEEAARAAGYALGVKLLTPEEDLDRTISSAAAEGGGLMVIGFDRLAASALDRIPENVPCAAIVEAPSHGRTPPVRPYGRTTAKRPVPPPRTCWGSATAPSTTSRSRRRWAPEARKDRARRAGEGPWRRPV